jgi:hypothetical protein
VSDDDRVFAGSGGDCKFNLGVRGREFREKRLDETAGKEVLVN